MHWHTYVGAYDYSVRGGGEEGRDKVVGMQLYIHRAMCMCVIEIFISYICRLFKE